ncbi:polysaccharide pyruvyl transferase CsaB [Desulfotruncus alcoholivorax]|uniref:polysaccharide pyruvyl transferase CsaB n=1 Tax=Desulfotruncus alcoholivorax TaxID=265477 RepID=UPI000423DEFD|nr:polysaccharide pyruvyl transferase CsaB [Desulfotruncus alcoholivorax]
MGHRIVISGYYGFNNLGDEAVLYSMLLTLRKSIPGLDVTVLSNDPAATARDYGVRAVDRWSIREVAGALRKADLLVSGGGSLLQDVTGLQSLLYYLGVIWLARMLGRPVMYYAQGIGPVNTKYGRLLVGLTTRGVRAVTVRDEESRRDLQAMGVTRPVEVTADPVLGLHPEDIGLAEGAKILRRHGVEPGAGVVGVAIRPLPGRATWEMDLARALDNLVKAGRTVVFIPMQSPADLVISREVAAAMREPSIIVSEKLNVPQVISLTGNLDLLLGMRLHALIFAAVCGVPPLGIVYDPKVERFLKRIDVAPAGRPGEIKGEALAGLIERLLADRSRVVLNMTRKMEHLRTAATRTAQVLESEIAASLRSSQ